MNIGQINLKGMKGLFLKPQKDFNAGNGYYGKGGGVYDGYGCLIEATLKGAPLGAIVGATSGAVLGAFLGWSVGSVLGTIEGGPVGAIIGSVLGTVAGGPVGAIVGFSIVFANCNKD